MKSWLPVIGAVVLAVLIGNTSSAAAQQERSAETKVCTLKISGMTCSGCEAAVRHAARQVDGVKDVKASYEKGAAEVTYDPAKTNPEAIAKVITERSGFKAEVPRPAKK